MAPKTKRTKSQLPQTTHKQELMGRKSHHHDPPEHDQGCIKGIIYHLHNQRRNFARKKLPHRRRTNRKRIVVDEDDGDSRPSHENGENREFHDYRTYNSDVEEKVSEAGLSHKKSMTSRIKTMFSEEVSKRKRRHKRSSSCPSQTQETRNSPINQNSPIHHLEPLDKSDVEMNEDKDPRSSPELQEGMTTNSSTCDDCDTMGNMNYLRQNEVNYKGKRPVKDHTFLEDNSIYAIDHRRAATLEESRIFLDALDLLNMRKELFLNVLRDPSSSLAQQLREKRSSKMSERLTKSLSFPCHRVYDVKDVNCKHESPHPTKRHTKSLYEAKNSCIYTSAGQPNDQLMPLAECSDESTPGLPQGQPTGNVAPVSPRHLNARTDKVVIKRFKNLGEKIRHVIKESRKERQHIIKDGVLDKIPHGKMSKGYKGQGETSEKPPKILMKNNLDQKSFKRASSFHDSVEKYNRLLDSDASRQAKGMEAETLRLRTNVTPLPIKSIPKRLSRIYSSPDLGFYHGLQIEEALDSTGWEPSITSIFVNPTSSEGIVISGKQPCSESSPSTENQTQTDKISKCENQGSFLDVSDAISKGENIENAGKDVGSILKYQSQENFEDAGERLNKIPKCECPENVVDAGVCLDKVPICESQENIVDAGDSLDRTSKCISRENIEDDDDDEGSDRMLKCESRQNFVEVCNGLDGMSRRDGPENIEDVDEGFHIMSKCESGENYVDAAFSDFKRGNSESDIDLIADKSNSSYQEDDTDRAKFNLKDGRLVSAHPLLDGEDSLASQQHALSKDGTTVYEIERGSSATQFHDTSVSQVQVDKNSRVEFDYVKGVLDLSGFNRNEFLGTWHSPGQPMDPAILDEVKGILLVRPELYEIGDKRCDYIILFDLVNEVLLEIYQKSSSYWPKPLSFRSCIHPMPIGYHVLEEVWADINYYLRWKPTTDQAYIDDGDAVAQDFSKYDGWMNLQFDSECVGLELEELLFDDLLDELLLDLRS